MSLLNLIARPEAYAFDANEVAALRTALIEANRNTLITPVGAPTDVMLNADTGHLLNDYRYSDVAMAQICSLVAPGLLQLVLDVCGQWRKAGEDKRYFSGPHAIDIFNRMVRLRFDRKLAGMQLVRDTRNKTVDGLVGMRYRYLSNEDFFGRVEQTYQGTTRQFREACLYGRQLVIRYTIPVEAQIVELIGERFIPGFHFANTEVGGKSIRSAVMLIREHDNSCVLSPYSDSSGGRVVHSGKSFDRRLHGLLSNIAYRVPPKNQLLQGAQRLDMRKLELGGPNHEKAVRSLTTALRRKKLNLGFAKRVVSSAATKGRGDDDSLADRMPDERRLVLESRTYYDLFVALIREARQLPIDQRETAEQVAYAMLTGKVSIW
jgi:hypothetical protein